MKDCWLNPDGKIIEVGDCQHNEYASEILEKEMGIEGLDEYMSRENIEHPYQVLHKRGWVRIKFNTAYLPPVEVMGDCVSLCEPMRNTIDPRMNKIQMQVAKRICEDNGTTLHIAINDKRFW